MARTMGGNSSSRSDRSTRRSTRFSASQSEAVAVPAEVASSSRPRSRSRQIARVEASEIDSTSRPRSRERSRSAVETEGDEEEEVSRSAVQTEGDGEEYEEEEDTEPMKPLTFYVEHTKLNSVCKLQTKCDVEGTVKLIEETLDGGHKRWFTQHRQFKHMFHMYRHKNRKCMGMLALFLRAIETIKDEEMWFVVNGVPIRYSMREHALISGLDCGFFPHGYEHVGRLAVVQRVFGRKIRISMTHVREKLVTMRKSDDRLRIAILYFLCTVIERNPKEGGKGYIGSFLLGAVDNLPFCETFPWGRYTFVKNIINVKKVLTRFKEKGIIDSSLPGFILPLEILAFECIPELKKAFRKDVALTNGVDSSCPRMCKHRFIDNGTKGFSLEDVYNALGTTKEIYSTLEPDDDEVLLVRRLTAERVDISDEITDDWIRRLRRGHKIWWEDLYKRDIESRKSVPGVAAAATGAVGVEGVSTRAREPVGRASEDEKLEELEKRYKKLKRSHKKLQESHQLLQERLTTVEHIVSELKNGGNHDREYDDYVFNESAPDHAGTTNMEEPPENAESGEATVQETLVQEEPAGTTNMEDPPENAEATVQGTPVQEPAQAEPLLLSYTKEWEEKNAIDPLAKRVKRLPQRFKSPFALKW